MAGLRYKDAGVNIDAGTELVGRLRSKHATKHGPKVLGGIGGFASLVELPKNYREPVLVAGTDGVGTKLKLAFQSERHDTVGIDLVAMCVNDIITCGAKPLFFLDYFATSALDVDQAEAVIRGITEGCDLAECALVGGETAELPGFFAPGEYDIAGFALGVVEREQIIDGKATRNGDAVVGLASSGVHSNGFSLAQAALFEKAKLPFDHIVNERSLIDSLLEPTRIYEAILRPLIEQQAIHAMAHITGGGIVENLPRVLRAEHAARLERNAWTPPAIFELIRTAGEIETAEMDRVFNMGIGMAVVCAEHDVDRIMTHAKEEGCDAWKIGTIVHRQESAILWA